MGWLIACVLAMLLWRARRQLRQRPLGAFLDSDHADVGQQPLYALLVFTQELDRLHVAGTLDTVRYTHLRQQADAVQAEMLRQLGVLPQSPAWQQAHAAVLELLEVQSDLQERPSLEVVTVPLPAVEIPPPPSVPPPPSMPPPPRLAVEVATTSVAPENPQEPLDLWPQEVPEATDDYAWEPAAPSALERALHTIAGWPALLAPFLVQNIGWFIGGLCFVAGSVFLVTYTSGFVKTLTSFAILALYTLLLLWGGYHLRRHYARLTMSSNALLILGMLLVPLNVTAAVRVLLTAQTAPGLLLVGLLATALGVGGVYVVAMLVSGIMDRSLQRQHPRLFLALAAVQMAIPVLAAYPAWPLLLLCHGLILGCLAYGGAVWLRPWLDAIFLERHKLTYYAAGTLVYAAVVSFVHVTWGTPVAVPRGYYGPWLMLLCGLLFYVDAQLKPWRQQVAALSYLSFGLYGLSVVALVLAIGAPLALLGTLLLAVLLYGLVTWQYATLPPLYLLLGCAGWLYYVVVLRHLPPSWFLLGSLPGVAGFWGLQRWLAHQRMPALLLVGARVLVLTCLGVAAWSVWHAQPGWVAMSTGLLVMAGAFLAPSAVPLPLWRRAAADPASSLETETLRRAQMAVCGWYYLGTSVSLVVAAYTPLLPRWTWAGQSLWFGLLWAAAWTVLGLRRSRLPRADMARRSETFLNSALLLLALCSGLAVVAVWHALTPFWVLPLLLGVSGGVVLWISLALGVRWLFYTTMGLWGAAVLLVKLAYLPAPGSGISTMGLVGGLWVFLWWLTRTPDAIAPLRQERAALRAAQGAELTLLWCAPVRWSTPRAVVQRPLEQTMVVVWSLGVLLLGRRLLVGPLGWSWVLSAVLGAGTASLMAGSLAWPWMLSVSMTLGLGATLVAAGTLGLHTVVGLSTVGGLYALLAWRLGVACLTHPVVQSLARIGRLRGDRNQLAQRLYRTATLMVCLSLGLPLLLAAPMLPHPGWLLTVALATVFWAMAGRRYLPLESGALGVALAASWLGQVVPLTASWSALLHAPGLGGMGVLLSIGMWGIATRPSLPVETPLTGRAAYRLPLQVVAVQMALLAAMQTLYLVAPSLWGAAYTAGVFALLVLGAAGLSLLWIQTTLALPGLSLLGLGCLALSLLGVQSLWWHGTPLAAFWIGVPPAVDQWLALALMALGCARLAHASTRPWALSTSTLYTAACVLYSWAALGAVALCLLLPFRAVPGLLWVCLALALGLLPLARPLPFPAALRGIGIGLWCSAGVLSLVASVAWSGLGRLLLILWAYALWTLATMVMPRYNARWPQWAIAPNSWPWLGLGLLSSALVVWGIPWDTLSAAALIRLGSLLAALALYLFLLLRTSAWPVWPWLAVGAWTGAGLSALAAIATPWLIMLGTMGWANLLLLGVTLWQRAGPAITRACGWQAHDLAPPLRGWAVMLLTPWLLALAVWDIMGILTSAWGAFEAPLGGFLGSMCLGLTASWLHVVWLHPVRWAWHGSLGALFGGLLALWLHAIGALVAPPVFLALWSIGLIVTTGVGRRRSWPEALLTALAAWNRGSPLATLAMWFFAAPYLPFATHLLMLACLGVYAAYRGRQRQQSQWYFVALLAGVLLLHGWWFLYVPLTATGRLLPWYTLQLTGLTWLVLWAERRFPSPALQRALIWLGPLLAGGALLAWGFHLTLLGTALRGATVMPWLLGPWEAGVAVLAVCALIAAGLQHARRTSAAGWIYGVAALGGTLWVYGRLLWLGLAPVQAWDTVTLIGASYALFLVQRLVLSPPLLHLVLLLPLAAVLAAALQPASLSSSVAFFTIAGLYLALRRGTGRTMPLVLGLLSLNIGLYLWVPGWARASQVLQLYTVPAALSVLWLLHAHRAELRPQVLHSCRLAASSVLYVSATLDVFLRADIAMFLAALGLSLVGMILGIALRTRAFLYAGVSCFVLNVVGQMILLFPEQRLTRAIVLLVLGTLITGGMIWFNMQREALQQRLRVFRADLATWA